MTTAGIMDLCRQCARFGIELTNGKDMRLIEAVQIGNQALLEIAYQLAVANERAAMRPDTPSESWPGAFRHVFIKGPGYACSHCGQHQGHEIHK